MAYEQKGFDITRKSSGDMSSNQYKLVAASTTNDGEGCTLITTRGAQVHGVWQGPKSTQAEFGRVRCVGVSKVAAGDSSAMETAITVGAALKASSQAQAVPSTAATVNPKSFGWALTPLGTGSTGIISAFVFCQPVSTST